jgi:hypothetical protein
MVFSAVTGAGAPIPYEAGKRARRGAGARCVEVRWRRPPAAAASAVAAPPPQRAPRAAAAPHRLASEGVASRPGARTGRPTRPWAAATPPPKSAAPARSAGRPAPAPGTSHGPAPHCRSGRQAQGGRWGRAVRPRPAADAAQRARRRRPRPRPGRPPVRPPQRQRLIFALCWPPPDDRRGRGGAGGSCAQQLQAASRPQCARGVHRAYTAPCAPGGIPKRSWNTAQSLHSDHTAHTHRQSEALGCPQTSPAPRGSGSSGARHGATLHDQHHRGGGPAGCVPAGGAGRGRPAARRAAGGRTPRAPRPPPRAVGLHAERAAVRGPGRRGGAAAADVPARLGRRWRRGRRRHATAQGGPRLPRARRVLRLLGPPPHAGAARRLGPLRVRVRF